MNHAERRRIRTFAPTVNPLRGAVGSKFRTCLAELLCGNTTRTPKITLGLAISLCALLVGVTSASATAGAEATVAPAPLAGSPGLPDGRVYEEASPPNKNGNSAGSPTGAEPPRMFAEPGGDGVAYINGIGGGSIGESASGAQTWTVAKRSSGGWANYGAFPRTIGTSALFELHTHELGFSADLTKVFFWADGIFLPQAPGDAALMYDIPSATTTWLDPPPATSEGAGRYSAMAGFSSDMSTFYFSTRTGFYEYHDGVVSVAGVLPDGSVEPGANAAGLPLELHSSGGEPLLNGTFSAFQAAQLHNQVSEDGDDAFFVSAGANPQLYVRETAPDGSQSTVLVSQAPLLPAVGGLPAPAPHGVLAVRFPQQAQGGEPGVAGPLDTEISDEPLPSYVYASPDGSRAFFESTDALTSAAVQAEAHGLPAGDAKEYMFDTATGSLTYLPGVTDAPLVEFTGPLGPAGERFGGTSPILASASDGSRFLFNGPGGLSLWSDEGPEGGTVTHVEPYPVGGEARATPDGSVFAFETAAEFPGFNNGGSHFDLAGYGPFRNPEVYRYDVAENSLSCVSCPPKGIVPSGNAYMSHDTGRDPNQGGPLLSSSRGISEDGSRVFFDSPDPLVPQVTNTGPPTPNSEGTLVEHGRNVYEWENGRLFLISTGTSGEDDYIGDESASGNDVFFSTTQGLAPGDTDEGYDVYDARVPRPGDSPPAVPAVCEGDVCQGPPSVPALLGAPASATFNGLGNPPPPVAAPAAKPKPKSKPKACKKGFTKKKGKKGFTKKKGKCVKNKKSKRASNKRGAKR